MASEIKLVVDGITRSIPVESSAKVVSLCEDSQITVADLAAHLLEVGIFSLMSAEKEIVEARKILDMVEDNSLMPHPHGDPQTRLYCLAERAREFKENFKR